MGFLLGGEKRRRCIRRCLVSLYNDPTFQRWWIKEALPRIRAAKPDVSDDELKVLRQAAVNQLMAMIQGQEQEPMIDPRLN